MILYYKVTQGTDGERSRMGNHKFHFRDVTRGQPAVKYSKSLPHGEEGLLKGEMKIPHEAENKKHIFRGGQCNTYKIGLK